MTDEEEKLLWGWIRGANDLDPVALRVAAVALLDEVRQLRGESPPRIEVERADATASAEPMALLCVAPEETLPYWRGRAEALEDEVQRLGGLVRLLARD